MYHMYHPKKPSFVWSWTSRAHTVDGRNPAPPGMYKTPTYQLVSRISSINSIDQKKIASNHASTHKRSQRLLPILSQECLPLAS